MCMFHFGVIMACKQFFFSDQTEFAIQIPGTKGGSLGGSEIVNLEEHTETQHNPLSLGPAVVTDDESSGFVQLHHKHEHDDSQMEKVGKHQQIKKIRRHRRTASTGSNVVSFPQKELTPSALSSISKPLQHVNIVKPKPVSAKQHTPNRPGSAGSNPVMEFHRVQSPERIKETAHEVTKGITKLISEGGDMSVVGGDGGGGGGGGEGGSVGERSMRMRRVRSSGVRLAEGMNADSSDVGAKGVGEGESGTKQDHQALKASLTSSLPLGLGTKTRHKHEIPRNKPSGKTAPSEATEALNTSDPPPATNTSKKIPGISSSKPSTTGWLRPLRIFSGSLSKEKSGAGSGGGVSAETKMASSPQYSTTSASRGSAIDSPNAVTSSNSTAAAHNKLPSTLAADLSRTPSILSTSSTISTFPPSTLPSRNPSFAYDGGGESSPHSLESVEIGDSIENLLALQSGRMNCSYFIPIRTTKDTTSSSDEDSVRGYRHSRRKRSSGTTTDATAHSTQQSKGMVWCVCV